MPFEQYTSPSHAFSYIEAVLWLSNSPVDFGTAVNYLRMCHVVKKEILAIHYTLRHLASNQAVRPRRVAYFIAGLCFFSNAKKVKDAIALYMGLEVCLWRFNAGSFTRVFLGAVSRLDYCSGFINTESLGHCISSRICCCQLESYCQVSGQGWKA